MRQLKINDVKITSLGITDLTVILFFLGKRNWKVMPRGRAWLLLKIKVGMTSRKRLRRKEEETKERVRVYLEGYSHLSRKTTLDGRQTSPS